MWRDFLLQQALQNVLGLLAVLLHNPESSSRAKYQKVLLVMRNCLLRIFPVEQYPDTGKLL